MILAATYLKKFGNFCQFTIASQGPRQLRIHFDLRKLNYLKKLRKRIRLVCFSVPEGKKIKKWSLPKRLFKESCILEKTTNQLLRQNVEYMRNRNKIRVVVWSQINQVWMNISREPNYRKWSWTNVANKILSTQTLLTMVGSREMC